MPNLANSKHKAFTLVELLVTISIIGLLTSIVLVVVKDKTPKADIAKTMQWSRSIESLLGAYAVGIWNFDEGTGTTAADLSGYGNDGIINGATWRCAEDDSSYTPSGHGCALEFDGSGTEDGTVYGDNVEVVESFTNTDNYPGGTTYSIWLNADTDAVDRMSLLRGSSTKRHIEIYSISKRFRTEAARQNGYSFGTGNFPDNVRGVWSHFVIVFADSEPDRPVRWYQNGELFHTGDMSSGTYPDTEYFSFGSIARSTGSISYTYAKSFDGLIDDIRIYETALTSAQVEALYYVGLDNLYAKGLIDKQKYQERLLAKRTFDKSYFLFFLRKYQSLIALINA